MRGEPVVSLFATDTEMKELLAEFTTGLTDTCARIQNALAAGEVDQIRRIGHQLKGAGGGYGFPTLTDAGAKVERTVNASNGVSSDVRDAIAELIELCDRIQAGARS